MKKTSKFPVVSKPVFGIVAILIISIHVGCKDRGDPTRDGPDVRAKPTVVQPQRTITMNTDDGWTIVGDVFTPPDKPRGAVVLLHQRGGAATDWNLLCNALREKGFVCLAIDQRGAGRSLSSDSKLNGTNAPWDTSNDIDAAIQWLAANFGDPKHGQSPLKIGLVGASYGANNALIYAATHKELTRLEAVKSLVLFSPGTNYNGLDGVKAAKDWTGPIFIVYATYDQIAGLGPNEIRETCPSHDKPARQVDDDKHGTDLLSDDTIDDTVVFLGRTLQ